MTICRSSCTLMTVALSFFAGAIARPIFSDYATEKASLNKARADANKSSQQVDREVPKLIEAKKAAIAELRSTAASYLELQKKYHADQDAEQLHLLYLRALCYYLADDLKTASALAKSLLTHPAAADPCPQFDGKVPKSVIASLITTCSEEARVAVTGSSYYVSLQGGVKIRTAKEVNELVFGTSDISKVINKLPPDFKSGLGGKMELPKDFKLPGDLRGKGGGAPGRTGGG